MVENEMKSIHIRMSRFCTSSSISFINDVCNKCLYLFLILEYWMYWDFVFLYTTFSQTVGKGRMTKQKSELALNPSL